MRVLYLSVNKLKNTFNPTMPELYYQKLCSNACAVIVYRLIDFVILRHCIDYPLNVELKIGLVGAKFYSMHE